MVFSPPRLSSVVILFALPSLKISAFSLRTFAAAARPHLSSTPTAFQRKGLFRLFSSNSMTFSAVATPPVALREEDRVVWAGAAPPGWDPKLPRQSATSKEPLVDPPVAIADPYGWMRDTARTNETVLQHLRGENAYTTATTAHLEELRKSLYEEMVGALQETDYRTPRPSGAWYYYTRTYEGKSYLTHCRAPRVPGQPLVIDWDGTAESPILPGEQVILDVNALAVNQSYCAVGSVQHSPCHGFLAYSTDFTGGETCQWYVKDLQTEEIVFQAPKAESDGSLQWGRTADTLFYLKLDHAHRPFQLIRHTLSTGESQVLLEEPDELYWMSISKSLDDKYLLVDLSSKETSEIHYLDLTNDDDTATTLECVATRRPGVLYEVEHRQGTWWIHSNVGNLPNMALWTAPAVSESADQWKLVTDGSKPLFDGGLDQSLDVVACFARHVVVCGRQDGLPRVWVLSGIITDSDTATTTVQTCQRLGFPEDAYDVGLGSHYEYETDTAVVSYDSLVTPAQSIEIALDDTSVRTVLKERQVPGYDKTLYGCSRFTVTARDGKTEIPVSMVYHKSVMETYEKTKEPVVCHLYGYGSYGSCCEADFRSTRLALLQRGVVFIQAHVRGGGEMGRQWYEEPNGAKYLCKKNTFNDFVDVAKWLVETKKLTTANQLSCEGRSAGGLLIGASINQAPHLFRAAILGVPFCDVVPTMIDASIPLTAIEWEEWGNPNEKKYHQYMMEYSPVQNVQTDKLYPACLLTGGLHDPRVPYWEPAKLAATLRHAGMLQHAATRPVCVKMDLSAGHFSASDRYKYLKELAFDYAFLLDQLGLANAERKV